VPAPASCPSPQMPVQGAAHAAVDWGRDLLERLEGIPDPRGARGRLYPLPVILATALCATAAKARGITEISEWAREADAVVQTILAPRYDPWRQCFRAPHPTTVSRVLRAVDGDALQAALDGHLAARLQARAEEEAEDTGTEDAIRAVGIDGKAVRGAARPDGTLPHLVAAATHDRKIVLGQCAVPNKSGEAPAARALLHALGPAALSGALVTLDALHTCRETARVIVEDCRAGYLMVLKADQRRLHAIAARALSGPDTDFPTHDSVEQAHGRTERRTVRTAAVPDDLDFPHATALVRITRRRKPRGQDAWTSKETIYAVTSLPAGPARIATAARGHWVIENGVHWVRDTAWDEDHCRVRTGNAPRILAGLRNLILSLLRLDGTTNIAAALRHHARDTRRPLHLLGLA
jgi:predicted transposase YbfD/YdcC